MSVDKNPKTINKMFNIIASEYDYINNIMSFGLQKLIKNKCVAYLNIKPHSNVIDLCCGTGDIARIVKKNCSDCHVIGIDFSEAMLDIAKSYNQNIKYYLGDVTNLKYSNNYFDFAVMSFGLRNIQNAEKAVEEIYRILKPEGKFLHIDFGKKNFVSKIFDIITPFVIKNFTNNIFPYKYLIESKKSFPEPSDLIKDFESKGFELYKCYNFLFGVISAQIMIKKY